MNQDYQTLLADIKATIRAGRAKAIRQLSRSVIESYWDIGRRILESQQQHGWGKRTVKRVVLDARWLDKVTLAFCSAVFDSPQTKFRCYKLAQSNPEHWDY